MLRISSTTRLIRSIRSASNRTISKYELENKIHEAERSTIGQINLVKVDIALAILSQNNNYFTDILYNEKRLTLMDIEEIRGATNWFMNSKKQNIIRMMNEHNKSFDMIKDENIRKHILISEKEIEKYLK